MLSGLLGRPRAASSGSICNSTNSTWYFTVALTDLPLLFFGLLRLHDAIQRSGKQRAACTLLTELRFHIACRLLKVCKTAKLHAFCPFPIFHTLNRRIQSASTSSQDTDLPCHVPISTFCCAVYRVTVHQRYRWTDGRTSCW